MFLMENILKHVRGGISCNPQSPIPNYKKILDTKIIK